MRVGLGSGLLCHRFRSLRDTRTLTLESSDVLACLTPLPGFALPLIEVFAGLPPVESA